VFRYVLERTLCSTRGDLPTPATTLDLLKRHEINY